MILVDTGASGGNYASSAFVNLVEKTSHEGRSIKKSAGKGYLRATNPHSVKVPPMPVIGSCTIPLVFPPMDRVYEATASVVQDLPYSVVLGTAFVKENRSIISFDSIGGFKPSSDAMWVPFVIIKQTWYTPRLCMVRLTSQVNPTNETLGCRRCLNWQS